MKVDCCLGWHHKKVLAPAKHLSHAIIRSPRSLFFVAFFENRDSSITLKRIFAVDEALLQLLRSLSERSFLSLEAFAAAEIPILPREGVRLSWDRSVSRHVLRTCVIVKNMPCHAHVHAHVKKVLVPQKGTCATRICHDMLMFMLRTCHKKAWCHKKALVPRRHWCQVLVPQEGIVPQEGSCSCHAHIKHVLLLRTMSWVIRTCVILVKNMC